MMFPKNTVLSSQFNNDDAIKTFVEILSYHYIFWDPFDEPDGEESSEHSDNGIDHTDLRSSCKTRHLLDQVDYYGDFI